MDVFTPACGVGQRGLYFCNSRFGFSSMVKQQGTKTQTFNFLLATGSRLAVLRRWRCHS